MEKFATNCDGLIDSGTEILAGNLDCMQLSKELSLKARTTDCFSDGVLYQQSGTPFAFTDNGNNSFSIGTGVAYLDGERIEIKTADTLITYDATLPAQTSDDGIGGSVLTPKSTGAANIKVSGYPYPVTKYVGIKYLLQCDNRDSYPDGDIKTASYSVHPLSGKRMYFNWTDGYIITLADTISELTDYIYLGKVTSDYVIPYIGPAYHIITPDLSNRPYISIKSQVSLVLAGNIADGTIITQKLANNAVTEEKLGGCFTGSTLCNVVYNIAYANAYFAVGASGAGIAAIHGCSVDGSGVYGKSTNSYGLTACSITNKAIYSHSSCSTAVHGEGCIGLAGYSNCIDSGIGVCGYGGKCGVVGDGCSIGVYGLSTQANGIGVCGYSQCYYGISGCGGITGIYGIGTCYDFFAAGACVHYGCSSSIRWKNNINSIKCALDTIQKIEGVEFDWDEAHGGKHALGFIAECLGEVIPESTVYEDSTVESNLYRDKQGCRKVYANGIDSGVIIPVLVQAIKELKMQVDNLKK